MRTRFLFAFVLVSVVVTTFTSCLKSDNNWQLPSASFVNVVHLSPTTGSIDFEFEPNRINSYGFTYRNYSGYLRVNPGERTFEVYKSGSGDKLLDKNISIDVDKYYTLIITDTASKMDAVVLRDSTRSAGDDSVRIRFANMSPDVAMLNFYVEGINNAYATNVEFKKADEFFSMKAGSNIKFQIRKPGSSAILATSESYNLRAGYIYTIFSSGYMGITSGDGPIRIGRMEHH